MPDSWFALHSFCAGCASNSRFARLSQRLFFFLLLSGFLDRGASWAPFSVFVCPLCPRCFSSSGLTLTLSRLLSPLACVSAKRERRASRQALRRGHGTTRLLHPARAQRIGEAARPGPSSSSSTSSSTSSTDVDDDSLPPAEPAPPTVEGSIHSVQINVRMSTGRPATLKCRWLPKFGSWKWSTSKFAHQAKGPPGTVLRQWAARFAAQIDPEGLREIESVLALHPDPPVGPSGSAPSSAPPPVSGTASSAPPPTAQDLPAETELDRCTSCFFWLGQAVPTQRTIPKSSLTTVDHVCAHILRMLHDPQLSTTHRRVLLALAITAPRWLTFLANDWRMLIHLVSSDHEPRDLPASPLRTPGVLTAVDHKRHLQAARQGRLTTAWRQLYSYGVVAATHATQLLLQEKWVPAPAFPTERQGHYLAPSDAHDLLDGRTKRGSQSTGFHMASGYFEKYSRSMPQASLAAKLLTS